MPTDMVFLGAEITIRDEGSGREDRYKIVSSLTDADDLPYREVTSTGPMGQALMKARVGDTVRVNLPKGEKRLTIIIIH
jgi:transcription elongation GreA/GreB family factor